ncbi:hypothetical protein [uncultured Mucilaginibacter sp.]|uniref:hypothetical protein n=1 Tax=uncultured Mucilaginibacter sp. TaxID=797541 RepID=UPI002635FF28|nr:hypothetical protein [uncultured Mucilaginibacter sp.]
MDIKILNTSYSTITLPNSFKVKKQDPNLIIKQGIYIYFLLLILEGALRKWFLPGLSGPLLIIRDPVAIWLVYITWRRGILKANIYLSVIVVIGFVSIFTTLLLGHGNLIVTLFGARVLLFHFPIIFVIGKVFNREDLIKVGKIALWISIPMTVLLALQFYSPQTAWVNRGVGGDMKGAGYTGALGYSRPPGTFSFTTGVTMFYSLLAPYIFYFWLYPKNVNRLLLIASTLALLGAIPFSISRGLFFQVLLTAIFTILATFRKPQYIGKLILVLITVFIAFLVLSQTNVFQKSIEAFTTRLTTASKDEGGVKGTLVRRQIGGLLLALVGAPDFNPPFFGYGIGMGTNVGGQLLGGGSGKLYLIAEGEWERTIGEIGYLFGLTVIFIRLGFTLKLFIGSYKRLAAGDLLPWLLLSYAILEVSQGNWAQPTSLGFSVFDGGLVLASLNPSSIKKAVRYRAINSEALA